MEKFSLFLMAGIAGTDLGIKQYAETHLKEKEELGLGKNRIIFRRVHNHGMMLNLLDSHPHLVHMVSVMATGLLMIWQIFVLRKTGNVPERMGAAMMAGGAVSNTCDRMHRGYVVDYLAFRSRKAEIENVTYNLGDFAIFGGAVLILIGALLSHEK